MEKKERMRQADPQKIADSYREMAVYLAQVMGQIEHYQNTAEYWTKATSDDGRPADDLKEAMLWLGVALSSCVTYADEYAEDAKKEQDGIETEV